MSQTRFPSGIMGTCCIPWDEQFRFAESIFRRTVRKALTGTKHLYVFGTAGEGYAVTDRQFDQIVTAFADEMRQGGAEPMVGIVHLSLPTMQERIERARDLGVRLFQIALPCWGALSETELFRFFDAICGRFPDCRFVHYNLPRTKRLVMPQEYARLAAEHPNLVATKNCSDSLSFLARLLAEAPTLQHFVSEAGYLYCRQLGECGLLASFITNWTRPRQIFEAPLTGNLQLIAQLQREVSTFAQLFGFLTGSVHMDGSFDKMIARIQVPDFPIRLLPPYDYPTEAQFQQFAAALREQLPAWLPEESA